MNEFLQIRKHHFRLVDLQCCFIEASKTLRKMIEFSLLGVPNNENSIIAKFQKYLKNNPKYKNIMSL